jgi:hypothetical protein
MPWTVRRSLPGGTGTGTVPVFAWPCRWVHGLTLLTEGCGNTTESTCSNPFGAIHRYRHKSCWSAGEQTW